MRYFTIITLLISIIFLKTSCKKNDTLINNDATNSNVNISQFFNLPFSTNSAVARVAKELERQNQKTGFISTLATQAGFPVWDKSSIRLLKDNEQNSNSLFEDYEGGDTCILIPMVLQNATFVNAFISATIIDDSITLRQFYRNDYKAYPFKTTQTPTTSVTSAEDFAVQMLKFDQDVFGYSMFEVKDKRLFHTGTDYSDTGKIKMMLDLNNPNGGGGNNLLQSCIYITTTSSSNHCPYPPNQCPDYHTQILGPCDNCSQVCATYTSTTEQWCTQGGGGNAPGGPTGWPSAPPSGGGGGGTTGGNPPNPNCVVGGLIQEGIAAPNPCNPPTGGNPLPPIPANITWLKNTLNLNHNQVDFLILNPARATEVYNYLEVELNAQRMQIAKGHIEKMRTNTDYKNFVEEFNTDLQTALYSYETEVENNLINNPCLKAITNSLTKRKHQTLVYDLFKKEVTIAKPKFSIKFKYEEVSSLPNNAPASTQDGYSYSSATTISGAIMIIKLNTSVLAGKSKEWISSVILHEICHAINKAKVVNASFPSPPPIPTQDEEHITMIQKKDLLEIYNNLKILYPNANDAELKDLAIGGLTGVLFSNSGVLLNNALTQQITGTGYFPNIDISNAYNNTIPAYKDLTKGSACN